MTLDGIVDLKIFEMHGFGSRNYSLY